MKKISTKRIEGLLAIAGTRESVCINGIDVLPLLRELVELRKAKLSPAKALGARGGAVRSEAKAEAARQNAAKPPRPGSRPRGRPKGSSKKVENNS